MDRILLAGLKAGLPLKFCGGDKLWEEKFSYSEAPGTLIQEKKPEVQNLVSDSLKTGKDEAQIKYLMSNVRQETYGIFVEIDSLKCFKSENLF
jgi:hypothetical protein